MWKLGLLPRNICFEFRYWFFAVLLWLTWFYFYCRGYCGPEDMSFPAGPSKQAVLCGGQFLTFFYAFQDCEFLL
jgi:hypothetical protein